MLSSRDFWCGGSLGVVVFGPVWIRMGFVLYFPVSSSSSLFIFFESDVLWFLSGLGIWSRLRGARMLSWYL
jgi:hypothetical protein